MYKLSSHSGMELDVIAFGTFRIKPGDETYKAVSEALECGYTSFDTAAYYGNEADVGKAVSQSGIKAQITTKVWNDMQGYDEAIVSAKRSRDLLLVDSIDLLLVHWPTTDTETMLKTWEAFEYLKEEEIVTHIGVSNFNQVHIESLLNAGFSKPESNQIEVNPLFTQEQLRLYCENQGILIEAWRPLINAKEEYLAPLIQIANKYRKTIFQIAIKWGISSDMRILAKSIKKNRMKENINVFDFDLTSEEMQIIDGLNKNMRLGPDPLEFP